MHVFRPKIPSYAFILAAVLTAHPALAGVGAQAAGVTSSLAKGLAGTSWQLVKFQVGKEKPLTPGDRKYTLAFAADGGVNVRIDCNRGHGTWTSAAPGGLQVSAIALTRAMCPQSALTDRLGQDLSAVKAYRIKDGHLLLSVANGGTYEFAPAKSVD
jgi:heat shock protein HslJ